MMSGCCAIDNCSDEALSVVMTPTSCVGRRPLNCAPTSAAPRAVHPDGYGRLGSAGDAPRTQTGHASAHRRSRAIPASSTLAAMIYDVWASPIVIDRDKTRPHLPVLTGGAGALPAAERRLTLVRGALCSGFTDSSPICASRRRDRADGCTSLAT